MEQWKLSYYSISYHHPIFKFFLRTLADKSVADDLFWLISFENDIHDSDELRLYCRGAWAIEILAGHSELQSQVSGDVRNLLNDAHDSDWMNKPFWKVALDADDEAAIRILPCSLVITDTGINDVSRKQNDYSSTVKILAGQTPFLHTQYINDQKVIYIVQKQKKAQFQ